MKEKRKSHKLLSLLLCCAVLIGMMPMTAGTAFAVEGTRPAPDRVQSYIAASGFNATALKPNQAKFTYVEITSNSNSDTDSRRSMEATVKCVTVDAAIAKKIGYNSSGDATVSNETQLTTLKTKLKDSSYYHTASDKTLSFPSNSNAIRHQDIGKGTFRYLLSVEAYFNGTYYFDGAGINFETAYQGNDRYTVSVQVCGMTIYPDTASGEGDPPTKLKLVIDNQIGREFTSTNAAPNGYYGIKNYPNTYVANFRWICMPNTNLEIELRNNTVLHVGKYFRSSSSSAEIKTNIHADNLTISGNGVLLASNFNNLPYGATGTACSAIHANSLTVDSSNVVLDLTREEGYNCIEVPTPSEFKPINAKSIKLAAANGKWISGLSNDETSLKNAYSAYWDTFTTGVTGEGSSRLSTVTFGRTAGLSDAILNIGGKKIESTGAVTNDTFPADGNTQALSIKVKSPRWLSAMYLSRVDYTYTAAVYENGTKLFDTDKFALSNFGATDGPATVTLKLADSADFKPTAGKSYIVTFSITPKMYPIYGGGKMESAAINGNWLLNAVEKQDVAIPALELKMRTPLVDGRTTGPSIDPVNEEHYSGGPNASWTESGAAIGETKPVVGGTTYSTIRTLIANEGYKFTNATVVSFDGPGTVTNKEVSEDGKTLAVTVTSEAVFTVDFLKENNSQAIAQQYFSKDEKLVLPDQSSETPDGKIFAGWKVGTTDEVKQPGEEITVTESLTFKETWKAPETYGLRVFPSSQVYEVRQKAMDTSAKRSFTLYDTGNSDLGKITVSVDTEKTLRWGEYKEYLYLNGVQQDSVVLENVEQELYFELKRPTESTGAPKDFIDATVWLKITSENGDVEKTAQVKIKVTPGPYVVKCMLMQPNTAEGATEQYKLIEGSDGYSVTFVPSSIDSEDVPAGTEVGMVAPVIPGYDFKEWVDFSATDGSGVRFNNETSATTSFTMPKRDIGSVGAGIFAVYTPSTTPAHEHHYDDWAKLDDTYHYQTCSDTTGTCDEPTKVDTHSFDSWTPDTTDETKHYKECSVCHHKVYGNHEESAQITDTAAGIGTPGTWYTECTICHKHMNNGTIAPLVGITNAALTVTAPVYGAAPEWPTTTNAEYYVANTVWEPAVSGTFAQNTIYTVQVELKANGSNRFTDATVFTINDQTATVVGTEPTPAGTETVTLTYQFPATGSGSAGGGSKPTVQKPEITIIGSGKADLSADGRTATIAADAGNELVSITLNGKEVAKTDKLTGLKTGDKVVITFRKTADDSAAITKSIASKVSQMQLIARSSKTAKKNIKVVLKTDAKTTALIKDIQDLGYTVKYKFYRSTKKSASYKAMLTKDEAKYLNTIGKKGTMYYYKARVMVYDKSGKLVAQSELKQCKYANRLWTK